MRIYRYSFIKVVSSYWIVFCLPFLAGYAFWKVGLSGWSWVDLLPILLTYTFLSIPIIMIYILLKTEIHINEREIARKGIAGGKTLLWEDVISIERGHIYTISLDKPRDITITAANNNRIYVYGFLEDIEGVEHDIREYSKKEFVQKN